MKVQPTNTMKIILTISALATILLVTACDTAKAPATGPTSGIKSQTVHSGNTQGGEQATQR